MAVRYRQAVPRPDRARRIGAPSWAGTAVRWEDVAALLDRLPAAAPAPADAAVLVALYERDGEPMVVLIRRSDLLARDPGHVAFPGGRIEPGESALEAALREAREEVGLDPLAVVATGSLGTYGRRDRRVAAFLAVLDGPPRLTPDPGEVELVLDIALNTLIGKGTCWEERWETRPMYFFAWPSPEDVSGDLVWGLTAWILWELASRLLSGGSGKGLPCDLADQPLA